MTRHLVYALCIVLALPTFLLAFETPKTLTDRNLEPRDNSAMTGPAIPGGENQVPDDEEEETGRVHPLSVQPETPYDGEDLERQAIQTRSRLNKGMEMSHRP